MSLLAIPQGASDWHPVAGWPSPLVCMIQMTSMLDGVHVTMVEMQVKLDQKWRPGLLLRLFGAKSDFFSVFIDIGL